MTCLPFHDLTSADVAKVHNEHLARCARCRALVQRLAALTDPERYSEPDPAPALAPAGVPRQGSVWTFQAPSRDEYLVCAVLEAEDTDLLVIPLVTEVHAAADADMVLEAEVLGYEALASLWAATRVLVEQAVDLVAVLSEAVFGRLATGYDAFFGGTPVSQPTGVPVLSDQDPRMDWQAALADHMHGYFEPWAWLSVDEELGPVIQARREAVDVLVDDVADLARTDHTAWRAFEAAQVDPYATISAAVLARVIDRLGLYPSRRLVALARNSVVAHHRPEPVVDAPGFARQRHRTPVRRRRDPLAIEAAADQYAAALSRALSL